MTSATLDTPLEDARTSVRDRAVDALRHAANVSHEARLLKSLATDAVDDGVDAAKRAFKAAKRGIQTAADLRDEAACRMKREPLKAVGLAFGAGMLMGMVVAWAGRRRTTLTDGQETC